MHPNAAEWLVNNRKIHGVAIDTASIDYGQSKSFQSHRIMTKNNIFFVENLNTRKLDQIDLVNQPFLSVSPLKIESGSGSPVRPILINNLQNGGSLKIHKHAKSDL